MEDLGFDLGCLVLEFLRNYCEVVFYLFGLKRLKGFRWKWCVVYIFSKVGLGILEVNIKFFFNDFWLVS